MSIQTHPDLNQLAAFGHGKSTEVEESEIAAHLDTCVDCQRVVDTQPDDAVVSLLRNVITTSSGQLSTTIDTWLPTELANHPRYRLVRWLGAGGMGVVYEAEHRLMERRVAIKVISKTLTTDAKAVARFKNEVKAAAKLAHPNIVTAYDAEQAGDLHFLVMEFIEGKSLARLIEDVGRLPVGLACEYLRQAALGLQHACEQGMVHRDIKPQNLMLTPKGQVKILDFGLAGFVSDGGFVGSLTGFGQGLGTPDYIAPEQIRDAHSADIRADIYSLGCTFYFLLTGQPPFPEGSVSQKIAAHLERTPRSVSDLRSDLPVGLAQVVERMMAKSPDRRYQKPGEVSEALAPFAREDGKSQDKPGAWRRSNLNRLLIAGGVLGVMIASVIIFNLPGMFSSPSPKGKAEGKPKASDNTQSKAPIIDSQMNSRFSEVDLEKPFDKYLLANPLLMEIAGAKIIRQPNGSQIILSVASTVLKDNSAQERIRAERVCRIRAIASIVAEKEGVHVYRIEESKEQRIVILVNGQEKGKSISELLEITRTKTEGITKDMPVVGRWKSKDGNVFYLALGRIVDRKGNPIPEENP